MYMGYPRPLEGSQKDLVIDGQRRALHAIDAYCARVRQRFWAGCVQKWMVTRAVCVCAITGTCVNGLQDEILCRFHMGKESTQVRRGRLGSAGGLLQSVVCLD